MVERLAAFAFDAEIVLDATLLSHQTHQALGLMSIELIGDKEPDGPWVTLDRLSDMGSEVLIACVWGRCWESPSDQWPPPG